MDLAIFIFKSSFQNKMVLMKASGVLAFAILISFYACTSGQDNGVSKSVDTASFSLAPQIIGQWENVSIVVEMYTANNTDSSSRFSVTRDQWEEKLNIKPIKTSYLQAGTFTSEYSNLQDSIISVAEGSWSVVGDSLALTTDGVTTFYHTTIENDTAQFTGYLDWDGDGQADDLYFGIQRKL